MGADIWMFIELLIPASIVYLIIISVIEVITHGIPETLGCILESPL